MGVFRIHHYLDAFVLHFRSNLLVYRGAANRLVASLDEAILTDDGGLFLVLVRAGGAGHSIPASNKSLSSARNPASGTCVPVTVLRVQIAPLVLCEIAVFCFIEKHSHPLNAVEIECPAITSCDIVSVEILLVTDFNRAVKQGYVKKNV